MKLKTFTAQNIPEAMESIRQELGDEVLIVSSVRLQNGGVQLVVATEEESDTKLEQVLFGTTEDQHTAKVRALLTAHQTPALLIQRLIQNITDSKRKTTEHLLEEALGLFPFAPISLAKTKRAFLITGAPASGKTITTAKLAVEAVLKKLKVSVLTLDTQKAGGTEQLSAFTNVLHIPLKIVSSRDELPGILAEERFKSDLILIDMPGLNPWLATDIAQISELKQEIDGLEPLLTLPTGLDSAESGEMADSFARGGCMRLIPTRLDLSHSFGNILYAAHMGQLPFCNYSISAAVADPLPSLSPKILATLMVKHSVKGELFS